MAQRYQFWIDRGGTFTDVVALDSDGRRHSIKLLSDDPEHYADAALAGIRRILGVAERERIPSERIAAVKMGTTVATNALLERRGEPVALFITRGFRDQLRIGYQNRPRLFAKRIDLPEPLYARVFEVDERLDARGEVVRRLDEVALREALTAARAAGLRACAIVFMHAYLYPQHEVRAVEIAREVGFEQVSASHCVSPLSKLVSRGHTTVVDAYLSPVVRRYVEHMAQELGDVPLYFMKSNGGLSDARAFQGKDAILSGPAGGIVGMVRTARDAGYARVIGFDMGGTSTDVSHFAGRDESDCERVFETRVAGVFVRAPMLAIHTIAAGGGSVLHFDGRGYRVGPDSAGASPGPCCYRRGGPLTITDSNVLLGRIQPRFFPRVFGPDGDRELDLDAVQTAFEALTRTVRERTGQARTREEVADGFLRVAVNDMANAIKFISVQRGYDLTDYVLCCFGGAGAQHACLVADELGIRRVFVHPFASVLSALGVGLARVTANREQAVERPLEAERQAALDDDVAALLRAARDDVAAQGVEPVAVETRARARVRYEGTDTALTVAIGDAASMRTEFESVHCARFGFTMPGRRLVVEAVSVEARAAAESSPSQPSRRAEVEASGHAPLWTQGEWCEAPVYRSLALATTQVVAGPALIAEEQTTIVVEPGWVAHGTERGELVLERSEEKPATRIDCATCDPVLLEVFNGAFMNVAEQMGVVLQNTAESVNIKERLDFSCALFDESANLVANAPHMPVHLGSMGESVRVLIDKHGAAMRPGDVYALNDPYKGGTHLPDVTVVMPVFDADGQRLFYVAARGHHADIGGITPGSMPPSSRSIEEEGVLLDAVALVKEGKLLEAELFTLLTSGPYPARDPRKNLADLRAQIAACEKGRRELLLLVERYGIACVRAYMRYVQDNAEESVRAAISALSDGEFSYPMDNGAVVYVRVSVDRAARSACVDFSGSSAQLTSNFNAPRAVVHAAVLYVFRTLVDADIPMNAGCLRPVRIVVPEGSMLSPRPPAATVAGNVETSQCVTDALYGALGIMAAAQGTMNNFTFGNEHYQYYETIAGGSGAGAGFHGAAAVQTHMTNSRMTDPEVIEQRFPVRVDEHSIRVGSGGHGRFRGGDGALRRIRFLEPMRAAILSDRRKVPPYGMAGGSPGEPGATWVERADGSREMLASCAEVEVESGDVFVISTPSGGGYGVADA